MAQILTDPRIASAYPGTNDQFASTVHTQTLPAIFRGTEVMRVDAIQPTCLCEPSIPQNQQPTHPSIIAGQQKRLAEQNQKKGLALIAGLGAIYVIYTML